MSFRDLDIKIRYRSNEHDFPRDFFIPVLKETVVYKRSVGYFSTSSLIDLSTGLFAMAEHGGKVQLICSPKLSSEDIQAIDLGYKTREEVIIGALEVSLTSPLNFFEEERLMLGRGCQYPWHPDSVHSFKFPKSKRVYPAQRQAFAPERRQK